MPMPVRKEEAIAGLTGSFRIVADGSDSNPASYLADHNGVVYGVVLNLAALLDSNGRLNAANIAGVGGIGLTPTSAEFNLLHGLTATTAALNALLQGVAAGYRLARGVAAVTGTATVVTGLATVVAVIATPADDPDGVGLAMVSATIGDQAGTPAAGSVLLKAWKVTATGNATLIAATAAKNINWIAIGT